MENQGRKRGGEGPMKGFHCVIKLSPKRGASVVHWQLLPERLVGFNLLPSPAKWSRKPSLIYRLFVPLFSYFARCMVAIGSRKRLGAFWVMATRLGIHTRLRAWNRFPSSVLARWFAIESETSETHSHHQSAAPRRAQQLHLLTVPSVESQRSQNKS